MKFGYARCSTLDQNLDWQIDALTKDGCDRIFQEKFTGTRKDRPELLRMMDVLREGDTVIICELIRERTMEGLAPACKPGLKRCTYICMNYERNSYNHNKAIL